MAACFTNLRFCNTGDKYIYTVSVYIEVINKMAFNNKEVKTECAGMLNYVICWLSNLGSYEFLQKVLLTD